MKMIVATAEFCRTNLNRFEFVRLIATAKLAEAALSYLVYTSGKKSLRQNINEPMREHHMVNHIELADIKNTIILFVCPSKILHKHCFYFLLGLTTVPRETGNNAYAKFWRDKQRVLWYFLYWLIGKLFTLPLIRNHCV